MKKQLLLFVMASLPLLVIAHDIEVQNADGVTIYYNYINNGTELEVTMRGDSYSNFFGEYKDNIIIPENVSFMNRTRKVTSIGECAFSQCQSLKYITIPNSITSIGDRAFQYCTGLTSIIIPNSAMSIGDFAFDACSGLISVTIGNGVMSIGKAAFRNCSDLKNVIVSDISAWCSIKFSGFSANPLSKACHLYSDENTEIKDLVIPNSVTSIGSSAFYNCSGLTSVTIPNSVTKIGASAFNRCSGLTSVTIGNSVTSIDDYTFLGCSGLTSVVIPNSVMSIGYEAFHGCSGLISVTIGNSVKGIGAEAFSYCSSLTSVTIPNSVRTIDCSAFYRCSGLTSVTIGNSVVSIEANAFDGADIPIVVSLIENPFMTNITNGKSSYSRIFSLNTFNNATLYVPNGTIDKYKATNVWKDFVFIEEGTPASISTDSQEKKTEAKRYTIDGNMLDKRRNGLNIILYNNGTTRKVVVK